MRKKLRNYLFNKRFKKKQKFVLTFSKRRLDILKLKFLEFFIINKKFCEFFFFYKLWCRLQLPLRTGRFNMLPTLFFEKRNRVLNRRFRFNDVKLIDGPLRKKFKYFLNNRKWASSCFFKKYGVKRRKSFPLKGFFMEGLRMAVLLQKLYRLKRSNLRQYAFRATSEVEFCRFLEMRLDVVLFRSGFFSSIVLARRAILNGFIFVNGSCIKLSYYNLLLGDCVSIVLGGRFLLFSSFFYSFLTWRRYYRYNICFFQRVGSNFFEVDFLRLRIVIFRDPACQDFGVYRNRFRNWPQTKLMPKKFFQVGLDYGFLYKFLLFH